MSELFGEVDEELRREQLKKIWDRYSALIIAAAVLVVAAVGGWRGYQSVEAKKSAVAGSAFEAAAVLADQNKSAEAEAAFTKLAATAPSGYRGICRDFAPPRKPPRMMPRLRSNSMTQSRPTTGSAVRNEISRVCAAPDC